MTTAYEPGVGAQAQVGASDVHQSAGSARAWYVLGVLIVALLFGAIDRQILTLLAEAMKRSLSLTDLQIGEIQGFGPALFSAVAALPLAWLADRIERRTVLCACVILWSIATAACGLATNFVTLFACTIGIAIGEASLAPIVYSLIPDLFSVENRPRANIICYAASALAMGFGLTIGGWLLSLAEDLRPLLPVSLHALAVWRLVFFLVALPGPLVAIAVFLIGATRRAVAAAKDVVPAARMGTYLREHGAVVLGVYGATACFGAALLSVGAWLPIALIRTFHVTAASVGVNFGATFMAGATVGMIVAALMTPWWRRLAGAAYVLRAITVASVGAAVPILVLGFAATISQAYVLVFVFSVMFINGTSLMPGMMQDIAPGELRARIIAVGMLLMVGGGSIGPVIVGVVSDRLSGSPRGLIWAIAAIGVTGFLVCAVLSRLMEPPYRRTVAAVSTA